MKERPKVRRDGNGMVAAKAEYIGLPLALNRQFRLYRESASTFKMYGSDHMRFEMVLANHTVSAL